MRGEGRRGEDRRSPGMSLSYPILLWNTHRGLIHSVSILTFLVFGINSALRPLLSCATPRIGFSLRATTFTIWSPSSHIWASTTPVVTLSPSENARPPAPLKSTDLGYYFLTVFAGVGVQSRLSNPKLYSAKCKMTR